MCVCVRACAEAARPSVRCRVMASTDGGGDDKENKLAQALSLLESIASGGGAGSHISRSGQSRHECSK